ncbi:MAG: radical SAM protein [Caldilineaceae bacterium]
MQTRIPVFTSGRSLSHTPLALGLIQTYAQSYNKGAYRDAFEFIPLVDMTVADAIKVGETYGPGVWLFSDYVWSTAHNAEIAQGVKALDARNLTIHGGPNIPKRPEAGQTFMLENPHVDILVRNEGEATVAELLAQVASQGEQWRQGLEKIEGITFFPDGRHADGLVRTSDRARLNDLDLLPSPYLQGVFDAYPQSCKRGAIIETNRGCPYSCTFCDWGGLTQQKIKLFDMERLKAEIEWIARAGIPILWIADANFGVFDRDIDLATHISSMKRNYGYPNEVVVNYAKNAPKRIAEIVKIWRNADVTCQGIISIQTTDEVTLNVVKRSNIKTKHYDELVNIFREEELPLSTDLMMGLPGATVQSFKHDLQIYLDKDVTIKAYPTKLLTNSPMADPDYRKKYQIEVDQNDMLISTYSYTRAELYEMYGLYALYELCEHFSFLRYIMRYLQWDYGIPAMDFVHAIMQNPQHTPTWIRENADKQHKGIELLVSLMAELETFYADVSKFAQAVFQIPIDDAFNMVVKINQAVLPLPGRTLPVVMALPYDFERYFLDHLAHKADAGRLTSYGPGQLVISDPYNFSERGAQVIGQYNMRQSFWELDSSIRKKQTRPNFVSLQKA